MEISITKEGGEMKEKMRKYFEVTYLKNTCFDSLDELKKDTTSVMVNAPRVLIACNLLGIWQGLNDPNCPSRQNVGSRK